MTHEDRIARLEKTVDELGAIVDVMARMSDPTAAQLSREDRDALVAYARSTRDDSLPSVSHESG